MLNSSISVRLMLALLFFFSDSTVSVECSNKLSFQHADVAVCQNAACSSLDRPVYSDFNDQVYQRSCDDDDTVIQSREVRVSPRRMTQTLVCFDRFSAPFLPEPKC